MIPRTLLVVMLLALGTALAATPVASAEPEDRLPCWSGPEWSHPAGLGKCHGCDCGGDLESSRAVADRDLLAA